MASTASGPGPATTSRRGELLEIAGDLFARSGYTRTSLRDVADAAGILAGSLYHHFPSKEALAVELVEAFHGELDELARHGELRSTHPVAALQEFAQQVAAVAERHRAAVHLCRYDAPTTATATLRALVRHEPAGLDARWAALVDRADDELRPEVDRELLRTVLRRSVIDVGSLPSVHPRRDAVDALTELVLRGLAPGSPVDGGLDTSAAAEVARKIADEWRDLAEAAPDGRREQILAAARVEFARRGFEATTVRDIADTARIRGSSLYRHVSSKDALLTEIMDRFSGRLLAGFEAVGQAGGTAAERLDAILILMTSAAGLFRREFVIVEAWWRTVDSAAPDPALRQNAARLTVLRSLLDDGVARGEFRPPPHPELLALALRSVLWLPLGGATVPPERHHGFLRTCLLHGAALPPPPDQLRYLPIFTIGARRRYRPGVGMQLRDVDASLMDPDWYRSETFHQGMTLLRDEDPVRWIETERYGRPFWVFTRHEDVKWALDTPALLSNREGARMPRIPSRTDADRRVEMGYDTRLDYLDDPMHAVYRRPLNKHFSVPAVKRLATAITAYIHEIIDGLPEDAEFDFVDEVAVRLPVMVVAELLGVPRADWALLQQLSSRIIESHDPRYVVDDDPLTTFKTAYLELVRYAEELILDRRRTPRDDFATVLAAMRADHEPLSLREARSSILAMVLGGFDTTRHALGIGVWQLLRNPAQRRLVAEDPSVAATAADETVRWATPTRSLTRVANEDFTLRDKRIRAGDWVSLLLISANRDERAFADPFRFDVTRTPNDYLSFGEGVHKCLGRNLIRLELSAFLPLVVTRLPDLELVAEPTWLRDTSASGLATLPVRAGTVVPRSTVPQPA